MQIFYIFLRKYLHISKKYCTFAPAFRKFPYISGLRQHHLSNAHGRLPEWLGIGLQNRGQQFESATDLTKMPPLSGIFY